jgi:hypothetical protein
MSALEIHAASSAKQRMEAVDYHESIVGPRSPRDVFIQSETLPKP